MKEGHDKDHYFWILSFLTSTLLPKLQYCYLYYSGLESGEVTKTCSTVAHLTNHCNNFKTLCPCQLDIFKCEESDHKVDLWIQWTHYELNPTRPSVLFILDTFSAVVGEWAWWCLVPGVTSKLPIIKILDIFHLLLLPKWIAFEKQ